MNNHAVLVATGTRCRLANLLPAAAMLLLAACGANDAQPKTVPAAPAAPAANVSIYQLDHHYTDQAGKARTLADHRGKPVLIAMIFTHCAYACPAIVADIKRTITAAGDPTELRVALVTMDHKRDLPAVLQAFATEHGLDPARYSLLHGDADAVVELAAVLGVRYAEVEGGDFSHSNRITLLDREGNIAFRQDGLGEDTAPLAQAVRQQFRD